MPSPAPTTSPTTAPTTVVRGTRSPGWPDVRWSLVTLFLGPVADRQPDLALSLLACADEAVAAGRGRWRRYGPWPARP